MDHRVGPLHWLAAGRKTAARASAPRSTTRPICDCQRTRPALSPLASVAGYPASLPGRSQSIMQYWWPVAPVAPAAWCLVLALFKQPNHKPCSAIRQAPLSKYFRPSSWAGKSSAIENILKISVDGQIRRRFGFCLPRLASYYMRILLLGLLLASLLL